jgi:septal ring factor EnvC (AmiA/AmiB activator)
MEAVLYFFLCVVVYYFVRVYLLKEHLTLQEVSTEYKQLDKKIDSLQDEYKALQQKIVSQENTMNKASSQASALTSSLSAAIR